MNASWARPLHSLQIDEASTDTQIAQVRDLFGELAALDLGHVRRLGLSEEDAWRFVFKSGAEILPGDYGPPGGRLLLATVDQKVAGCGAYRRLDAQTCELKRLFVRPEFRGLRVGRRLAESLIETARKAGYRRMLLDTTTYLQAAQQLYAALGFRPCPLYAEIPQSLRAITIAMERALTD